MSVNSGELIYRAAIASYINPALEARQGAEAATAGATIALDEHGLPLSPVARIEKYFSLLDSNNNRKVNAQDLANAWKSHVVKPTDNDLELIAREIDRFMLVADMDKDGFVSVNEYMHYMLTLIKEKEEGRRVEIHGVLADKAMKDPGLVDTLLAWFREKDVGGQGEILVSDFLEILDKVKLKDKKRVQISESVFSQPTVSYSQYVLLMLGRTPSKVTLISYDISGKATKALSRILFGRKIDGIWHTAVLAFGYEWWYGGDCFQSRPFSTPFGPKPDRTEELGETTRSMTELKNFIRTKMRRKFNYSSYDVMHNNCNNFTNDIAHFLIHKGIRRSIVSLPGDLLSGGLARLMRPFLNKWLGNFKGTENDIAASQDPDVLSTIRDEKSAAHAEFQAGDIAVWKRSENELIYCEILEAGRRDGKIKIRIFKNLGFKVKLILNKSFLMRIPKDDLKENETSINYLIALSILEAQRHDASSDKVLMKQITMGLIDGLIEDQHAHHPDPAHHHISLIASGGISDDEDGGGAVTETENCCQRSWRCLAKLCHKSN